MAIPAGASIMDVVKTRLRFNANESCGCQLALAYIARGVEDGKGLSVDGVPGLATVARLPFYDPSRKRVR